MMIRKQDVMKAAGSLQVCAGQKPGAEAAIHPVHNIFKDHNTEVALLIEAGNAIAAMNRKVMLHKSYYVHIKGRNYTRKSNSYSSLSFGNYIIDTPPTDNFIQETLL